DGGDPPDVVESMLDALALLGADGDSAAAAILHAYPAWEQALRPRIERDFPGIAPLLEGQRAAGQVWELHAQRHGQAGNEGLRRLLLAIVRDLRVVPILLARQLARMRHAERLPEDERRELAMLTRDIHAPLANRLGIWQLKWELEDLAFRYLEPATYQQIARLLDEKRADRERYIEQVKRTLREAMAAQGLAADIAGRPKHIYSIWKKMQRKNAPIGELYDLRAVRVLVDSLADCYAALGVVHATWTPIPSEFDDYIARPKRNDYRSLHTAVIGPEGKTLEVQIRTHEMHRQAELGVAAHWKYKEVGSHSADAAFDRKIAWMRRLLESGGEAGRDEASLSGEFDTELVEDRIYVLTPKGEVIDLPTGATPLDFAYHVHTEVGHRCRGAKVDGRIVPLDHKLRTGDRVEILTAKTGEPRRDWLVAANGFLASGRSRDKVRAWFHKLDRARNETAGKELLDKELRRLGLLGADLAPAREKFNLATDGEVYVQVALGDIGPHQVGRALLEHERAREAAQAAASAPATTTHITTPPPRHTPRRSTDFTVEGVGNLLVQLARCCQPLPGEPIVGYLTRGRGVSVHRPDCTAFERLAAAQPQRVLPVEWGRAGSGYEVDVEVLALDRKWLLKEVTNLIAQGNAHVVSIRSDSERNGARVRLRLRLRVGDYGQLSTLLGKLSALPGVEHAQRR
ncbi:MAG: bifunctional (p)ppGpp synthetase/guanosine-3',5'-bis(diphosphate) 3'-pyrophosphohydrolase, partial [Lysobacter sp.]|nr:bifunctional (p)ppGpp synthetase/guanosine-3',5'-bis(diphosphate) 3'-pyrophosphohydrolase [Lysobacter sp.]